MTTVRQEKFASLLRRDIAAILQEMTHSHFEGHMVMVNDVSVTPDLGYAKVYLGFLNAKDKNYALSLVSFYAKEVRHQLAKRIRNQVRKVPEVIFFQDETLDQALYIEKLLNKIKEEDSQK